MKKLLLSCCLVVGMTSMSTAQSLLIAIEAENGRLGSDWNSLTDLGLGYISPKTDKIESYFPGSETKVATYSIKFPKAGEYELYLKVKVGSGGANDDSFFSGKGFGNKDVRKPDDWAMVNGFFISGYHADQSTAVVEAAGTGKTDTWKWVSMSKFSNKATNYIVPEGQLTQTFQIAGREDGLDIDKFVFAPKGTLVTVEQLNNTK